MERVGKNNNLIGLILCSLLALYFLSGVFFALLNFEKFASEVPQFLRYVAAPGVIAGCLVSMMFLLKPRNLIFVGSYGSAILAGLFLFEAFLTYRSFPVHMSNLGGLSPRQKEQVRNYPDFLRGFSLRTTNVNSGVESLDDALLSAFPKSSILLCAPDQKTYVYSADRFGFNNPDHIYQGDVDTIVLGDSFVEGFCLPPGLDLVSRMRGEGLNAAGMGIRGNGPLIELATLGRFGPVLKPRTVVFAFFEGNDWKNLGFELQVPPWLKSALSPQTSFGPVAINPETERNARAFVKNITEKEIHPIDIFRKTSSLRNFFALHLTSLSLGIVYPKTPPTIPEFTQILKRATEIARSWGGDVHLLYIPQVGRFKGLLPNRSVFDQVRMKVLSAANEAGIKVIDLVPVFDATRDPERFYASDAHLSEEGAAFVARQVAKNLSRSR